MTKEQRNYFNNMVAAKHSVSNIIAAIRDAEKDNDDQGIIDFMRQIDLPTRIKRYRYYQKCYYKSVT